MDQTHSLLYFDFGDYRQHQFNCLSLFCRKIELNRHSRHVLIWFPHPLWNPHGNWTSLLLGTIVSRCKISKWIHCQCAFLFIVHLLQSSVIRSHCRSHCTWWTPLFCSLATKTIHFPHQQRPCFNSWIDGFDLLFVPASELPNSMCGAIRRNGVCLESAFYFELR